MAELTTLSHVAETSNQIQGVPGAPVGSHSIRTQRVPYDPNRSVLLDRAIDEYMQLRKDGVDVDFQVFAERYPDIEDSLKEFIAAHQMIVAQPQLLRGVEEWPKVGECFIGFQLLRELGQGAFARVYLARQPSMGDRLVVLKVGYQSAIEAKTIGMMAHANVVTAHSVHFDAVTGMTAICMAYHGNVTLGDVLGRVFLKDKQPRHAQLLLDAIEEASIEIPAEIGSTDPLTFANTATYEDGILQLAIQLADALAHIHRLGVHHRDLKPSNVLMTRSGRPMLLDFNLSQDLRQPRRDVGGTMPYMAPEQLAAMGSQHESACLDERSDIYSLGVILYELLTLQHPYGPLPLGQNFAELRAYVLDRQECGCMPLRQRRRDLDRGLAEVIERCMSFDPRRRPATATELARDLRGLSTKRRRLARWAQRHAWELAAASVLLFGLVGGGTYVSIPKGTASERQYQAAVAAYERGDYATAIKAATATVESDPQATSYFLRARAHQRLGEQLLKENDETSNELLLAADDYLKAYESSKNAQFLACAGYCEARKMYWQEAIGSYQQAIENGYATASVHNNLGYCYLARGAFAKASEQFDAALALEPKLQASLHNRARVPLKRPLDPTWVLGTALKDIDAAISCGDHTAQLYYDAAHLYARASRQNPKLAEKMLGYLREAIILGEQPAWVEKDATFKSFRQSPAFQEVLASTFPATVRADAKLLIDQLEDAQAR